MSVRFEITADGNGSSFIEPYHFTQFLGTGNDNTGIFSLSYDGTPCTTPSAANALTNAHSHERYKMMLAKLSEYGAFDMLRVTAPADLILGEVNKTVSANVSNAGVLTGEVSLIIECANISQLLAYFDSEGLTAGTVPGDINTNVPDWDGTIAYNVNDMVTYQGRVYRAIGAGIAPATRFEDQPRFALETQALDANNETVTVPLVTGWNHIHSYDNNTPQEIANASVAIDHILTEYLVGTDSLGIKRSTIISENDQSTVWTPLTAVAIERTTFLGSRAYVTLDDIDLEQVAGATFATRQLFE